MIINEDLHPKAAKSLLLRLLDVISLLGVDE